MIVKGRSYYRRTCILPRAEDTRGKNNHNQITF